MECTSRRRWHRRPEKPLPLFDSPRRSPAVLPPASRNSRTSQAAALSVAHAVGYIEQRVIEHLEQLGPYGATADETEVALDLAQSTGSARFSELARDGRIIRTNRTRPTRRGRAAFVHVHPRHRGATCEA